MRAFFYWLTQEVNVVSWVILITLDVMWNLFDGMSIFSGAGVICYPFVIAGIFSVCFLAVMLVQHYISGDEWKPAMTKGAIFGAIAAAPFSIVSLIFGGAGMIVRGSRGSDYTYTFGRFSLNYRELEKTIKKAATPYGTLNGSWQEITMENAINALERAGKISDREERELHEIRIARNTAHHEETPANLLGWADQSERLLQKYRERFGISSS